MPETQAVDRVLTLTVIDGKKAKDPTGTVDTRLFDGKQTLHLKMDPQTSLWYFQYGQNGLLPEALKGYFTAFSKGYDFAESYFKKRNVQIAVQR